MRSYITTITTLALLYYPRIRQRKNSNKNPSQYFMDSVIKPNKLFHQILVAILQNTVESVKWQSQKTLQNPNTSKNVYIWHFVNRLCIPWDNFATLQLCNFANFPEALQSCKLPNPQKYQKKTPS